MSHVSARIYCASHRFGPSLFVCLLLACTSPFVGAGYASAYSQQGSNQNSANQQGNANKGKGGASGTSGGGTARQKKPPAGSTTPTQPATGAGDGQTQSDQAGGSKQSQTAQKDQSGQGGQSQGAATTCRVVKLGPNSPDAAVFKSQLDGAGSVTFKVSGAHELVLCGPPANVDVLETTVQQLSGYPVRDHQLESHLVRLFYFRYAKDLATAINSSSGLGTPVKALGDDLLLFPSESEADESALHELKRWIAIIDVPRPQLSVSAWSIQFSSKDWRSVQEASTNVHAMVSVFNEELHNSLQQAWRYLSRKNPEKSLDDKFRSYLAKRFVWDKTALPCPQKGGSDRKECPKLETECSGEYCLGYSGMFSRLQPSLTSMLIMLIGAKAAAGTDTIDIDTFVDCLESRQRGFACGSEFLITGEAVDNGLRPHEAERYGSPSKRDNSKLKKTQQDVEREYRWTGTSDCEHLDSSWYYKQRSDQAEANNSEPLHPAFSCFRRQLKETLGYQRSKALMRVALADFLFHYKTAELYPQNFIPWSRGASAQRLDSLFNPLLVEFNRDLTVYLRALNEEITGRRVGNSKLDSSSEGLITVRVISGAPASVSTTTQSFFTASPVLSVHEFLNNLKGGGGSGNQSGKGASNSGSDKTSGNSSDLGKSGNDGSGGGSGSSVPLLFSSNLTPLAAQGVLALAQGGGTKTAQVGRDLNLNFTANTLSGASSAELDVELDSTEHAAPRFLDENNNATDDNLSRVATHTTLTKVRVDSLKLFEISSFSATLTHGRSVPLLPPFIDLPYIGNLARLHLKPGTVFHRSFAIISAVIVPTAADIANAIEFRADVEADHLPKAEWIIEAPATKGNAAKDSSGSTSTTTVQVQQSTGTAVPVSVQLGSCPKCPANKPPTDKSTAPKDPPANDACYWVVSHYHEGISVSEGRPTAKGETLPVKLAWEAPPDALFFDIYRGVKNSEGCSAERDNKVLIAQDLRVRSYADNQKGTQGPLYHDDPSQNLEKARWTQPPPGELGNTCYWVVTHFSKGFSVSEGRTAKDTAKGEIALTWEAPKDAVSFDVYRGDKDGEGCNPQGNDKVQIASGMHLRSYTDDRKEPDKKTLPESTTIYSEIPNQPGNLLEFHGRALQCLEQEAAGNVCNPDELKLSDTPVTRYGASHH